MLARHTGKAFISKSRTTRAIRAKQAKQLRAINKEKFKLSLPLTSQVQKLNFDDRPIEGLYRANMGLVIAQANPQVQEALSGHNASGLELKKERFREAVHKWGASLQDTGSPAVQVVVLTEHIYALTSHLRFNHKDVTAFLKLRARVDQRRRALQYLSRWDYYAYCAVIKSLGIKDAQYPHHKELKNMKRFQ